MHVIKTPSLTLEPQTVAHAKEMFEVLRDPAIYEYENEAPPSLEWLRARFARLESRQSEDGHERWLNWVIRLPTSELVGYVQATVYPDFRAAIAYELSSAYWRRGLARQAVEAMISELVERYRVRRLSAVLKHENLRSLRLLERLGFSLAPAEQHVLPGRARRVADASRDPADMMTAVVRRLFLLLCAVGWSASGLAQDAAALQNWFDDPFFQISNAVPDCPVPAGPFMTEADRRVEAHHRAERGTTCWLTGQCDRPNDYAYGEEIAEGLKAALRNRNPFSDTTLWVTIQGRNVFIEGCVRDPGVAPALETFTRAIPNVRQAIVLVRSEGSARPPYKLLNGPQAQ